MNPTFTAYELCLIRDALTRRAEIADDGAHAAWGETKRAAYAKERDDCRALARRVWGMLDAASPAVTKEQPK